ncbi:hypothetical protein ACIQOU_07770 [Streptomyces sp. NPDC091279]|uniref:hypothetical protein n=1 Tax=unclassified Streptomyces TaxID=2593676 RepID=UPI00380B2995
MIEQHKAPDLDQARRTRRRRAGIVAFLVGAVVTVVFFAFFPGLPHVVDWGAILVALVVGGLARGGCQAWMTRAEREKGEHQ